MNKLLTLLFLFSFSASAAVSYLPGHYKIDPDHSRIEFVIAHLVISEVEGRFNDVSGDFTLTPKFTESSVSAIVDVASVDTAVKKRDDDQKTSLMLSLIQR
jgi:polyisoprenoid-binding protein YceI